MSNPFADAARDAVAAATGVPAGDLRVDAPPRPELGDFAVGVFPAAKRLGKAPPAIAAEVAAGFTANAWLASATAAGPFVNFTADRAAAFRWTIDRALAGELVSRAHGAGKTICIDYSSPNISKHLAYHHIRSTCIGHALAEIHRALGYRVVGINHLGDWGTTHGMIIAAMKKWGAPEPLDVTALNDLYTRWRAAAKTDPALEDEARGWFKKLEDGDPEARALWQRFREVSWAEFKSIYQLLGIEFDEVRGESAYEPDMPRVIQELEAKGLTSESEGALVVQIPDEKVPLLLKTKDGTTLYATRDIAAAEYRWTTYHFERSLYVVDRGQSMHFRLLFKTLALAGHAWAARCMHVPFGLVRIGGKKTSTREKDSVVLLKDVFAEATDEVHATIKENLPELGEDAVAAIARTVGIGAVVFANLATQREKDIDFTMEKATSLQGDSGPYIQYSHARCASVQRKGNTNVTAITAATAKVDRLTEPLEWAVARRLMDFGAHVVRAADACEPHVIAHYLLDLSGDYARWYTSGNDNASLRILVDDPDVRAARLALTAAVQATLRQGLGLLGLSAPDMM
jgi:arginyl-tRNA synthetase